MKEKNKSQKSNGKIKNLSFRTRVLILFQNEEPSINKTIKETLVIAGNESSLKNILPEEVVTDLDILERNVILSEIIHNFNLEQYIGGLDKKEIPETYTFEAVEKTIGDFNKLLETREVQGNIFGEKLRKLTNVALELDAYERAINASLSNDLYDRLVNYGEALVKSKFLDVCFEREVLDDVINDTMINGTYGFTYTDADNRKKYTVPVEKSPFGSKGYIYDTLKSIKSWKNSSKKANNTGDTYNRERNVDILDGCNRLKVLTLMKCYMNPNGKLAPAESMNTIEKKVKKYEKQQEKQQKVRKNK